MVDNKKYKIDKAVERRNIIRDIIINRGFKNIPELNSILKDEYGIDVQHETLHNDMRHIRAFKKEDVDAFSNNIIARCQTHLDNLDNLSKNAKYDNHKIIASKSFISASKEVIRMINMMCDGNIRPPEEVAEEIEKDEEIEIKFEEEKE